MAFLSTLSSTGINPGQMCVHQGGDQWLPYNQVGVAGGTIGLALTGASVPGNPFIAITTGDVPINVVTLGAGLATTVIGGLVPSRGASATPVGFCDTSGRITLISSQFNSTFPTFPVIFANDLSGNGTSTPTGQFVSSLSYSSSATGGPIAINGTGTTFVIAQGNTGFSLSQTQQANGSNPASITISPQAPGAGAASTATGTPGSLLINLAAPVSTGASAIVKIADLQSNGGHVFFGPLSNANGGFGAIWFGNITPNSGNYTIANNATGSLAVQAGASITLTGNTTQLVLNPSGVTTVNNVQLASNTFQMGGGTGVLGIANASAVPTSVPANGIVLYSTSQKLGLAVSGVVFPSAAAMVISQLISTTGAGTNASWTGQSAKVGSGGAGGNIAITAGAGDGAGATGAIQLQSGNGVGALSLGGVSGDLLQLGPTGVNITLNPQLFQFGANSSNPSISVATASGVPTSVSIVGQGAGGTNAGGLLNLQGGAHAGTQSDGHVFISTPMALGYVAITPSNGAQTLTNAQSNANNLRLLAGATGAFTINLLRNIVGGSNLIVRNETSQIATIAYLTGGTVTVAAGTSAVIGCDGANLVKILNGT